MDWIDRLSPAEAKVVLEAPVKTRYPARDAAGRKVTRYVAPTRAEVDRLKAKAAQ